MSKGAGSGFQLLFFYVDLFNVVRVIGFIHGLKVVLCTNSISHFLYCRINIIVKLA